MVLGDALNNELYADTGQEPVADNAFFASPDHQQVVLGETLNDKLIETNSGYGYEFDPGNGCGFNNANNTAENPCVPEDSYYSLYILNHHEIQFDEFHGVVQASDLLHHRPVEAVRDNFLSDLEPGARKLGSNYLETIFNDYYYDKFEARTEVAAI